MKIFAVLLLVFAMTTEALAQEQRREPRRSEPSLSCSVLSRIDRVVSITSVADSRLVNALPPEFQALSKSQYWAKLVVEAIHIESRPQAQCDWMTKQKTHDITMTVGSEFAEQLPGMIGKEIVLNAVFYGKQVPSFWYWELPRGIEGKHEAP